MNFEMSPDIKQEYFQDNYYTLLAGYVAGTLSEAENVAVASHLTLKPEARQIVRNMEHVAGACLEHDLEHEKLSKKCLDQVLERLDEKREVEQSSTSQTSAAHEREAESLGFILPQPLRPYLINHIVDNELKWKKKTRGIDCLDLAISSIFKTELLRIAPDVGVPAHTHEGEEITLLLDGAFEDETGHYVRGDLIVLDERFSHYPVSDKEKGCICLAVNSAPIKMTGPFMRLLNPFLK